MSISSSDPSERVPGLMPGDSAGSVSGSAWGSLSGPEGTAAQGETASSYGADPWSHPGEGRRLRPGARGAAIVILVCSCVTLVVLYAIFVTTVSGQTFDQAAFRGAQRGQGQLWLLASPVLDVVSEGFVVVGLTLAVLIAIVRRRWSLAFQAVLVIVGSNLMTQLLKAQLPRTELGIGRAANSFPSGHTTVAASVVVALLIVVPRRWRPAVALVGAVYAAGTGVSVLVGQWHRASDAVAAIVVVTLWAAVASLFMTRGSLDDATSVTAYRGRKVLTFLWTVGIVLGIGAVVVGNRTINSILEKNDMVPADMLTAYVVGAVAVTAATCLGMAVVLQLRQFISVPASLAARPSASPAEAARG